MEVNDLLRVVSAMWTIWRLKGGNTKRSCSAYSKTMYIHLSSRMISCRWMIFSWPSSLQSYRHVSLVTGQDGEIKDRLTAISLHADCDIPVYCMISPSLSGLNLWGVQLNLVR